PVRLPAELAGSLDAASNYAGSADMPNKKAFVEINPGTLTHDATWPALDVPYRAAVELELHALLTLSPGAQIEVADNTGLFAAQTGALAAPGTEDAWVTLRGALPDSRNWLGVLITTNDDRNRLHFVDIDSAGSAAWCCDSDYRAAALLLAANSRAE